MLRRTIWSVSPLADVEVTALSSVRASVWPREAAPHTGQQTSGELFRRHGGCKGPGGQKRSFCPRDHHGYWSKIISD